MLESLFNAVTRWKPLSDEQQEELFETIEECEGEEAQEARDKIIKHHIWLPCYMVQNHYRRQVQASVVDKEDLVQAGLRRMIEDALPKFEPERGYKFATYARWWILDGMSRVLRELSPVRVPDTLRKIQKEIREINRRKDSDLTNQEIADEIGEKKKQVELAKSLPEVVPLEQTDNPSKDPERSDHLTHDRDSDEFTSEVVFDELRQKMENFMDRVLTDKEQKVLKDRIGWETNQKKTLRELDSEMDICYERVRQIENEAREKLQNKIPPSLTDFLGDTGINQSSSPIRID